MGFLDYFKRNRQTASIAKDRLSIIVARERNATRPGKTTNYLPQLQQELLQVISKYEHIDLDQVSVHVDRQGDCDVLELNIVLSDPSAHKPDGPRKKPAVVVTAS